MASKNSLDDVFKTMRQYQQNNSGNQAADQPTSDEPNTNFTPSTNQIEIPSTTKQSKVQRLLSYLPFMHSPKRNLIYGIGGILLAIGLVLAAFHAIVSPTAPNSNGDRSTVNVTQSEKQHSDDQRKSSQKKTDSHKKKSDEKQSKQKKQESEKPEQKKQESKKPEQKKSEQNKSQPAQQQANQSRQSSRSAQHQAQPARHQSAQTHQNAQPAWQQAAQPSHNNQHQSQPNNNGGWSVNNGGQSANSGAGTGTSGNGTMADGVYDGWDDDSRVGIYDADGNLVN